MKKYFSLFKFSFITYVLVLLARPYITARIWADVIFILFLTAFIYQLIFVFYLRKKENMRFLNIISIFFIYAISSVSVFMLLRYCKNFFFGYQGGFLTYSGIRYYGIEAIVNDSWSNIICIPYFIFNIICLGIYYLVDKKLKYKQFK